MVADENGLFDEQVKCKSARIKEKSVTHFEKVEANMPDITPLTRKVLVIDFRPGAVPARWNRTDDLIPGYIEAMRRVSKDILNYQVVEKLDVPEYPVLLDNRQYTDATFTEVLADDKRAFRDASGNYMLADYQKIIQKFDILQKVEGEQIDEVWMFGGPYFGFYESRMMGRGAFWCNGPAMEHDCRRFVIMGFNYEREVKEMVHDYGHRSESVLAKHFGSERYLGKLYRREPTPPPANAYERFLSNVGTVHRKPGGEEYGQDEYAWLSAMEPDWWPPTIDPNLVGALQPEPPQSDDSEPDESTPVESEPAETKPSAPKPWYQFILDFFASLFGK